MSVEGTEGELQQLVSSDEENAQLNTAGITPPGSNSTKPDGSASRTHALHKVASDHSYRSSKVN